MNIRFSMALVLISVCMAIPAQAGEHRYGDITGARFYTNYDGDTLTVSIPGVPPLFGDKIPVRISGIDTPEIKGKCLQEKAKAKEAKALVKSLLAKAKRVDLLEVGRDKYFRINSRVIADGVDVGAVLLQQGMAVPYDGGTKTHNWCADNE